MPIGPAAGEVIYATSGTVISTFASASPGVVTTVPLTGMQGGETLVGIDVRPSTGQIYGVGSSSRLYVVNPVTGLASQVGGSGAFTLNGTSFGTDFNPNVDRIRQVSNSEQNLRLNPVDGVLSATDTAINPVGNIVATAYDRNDLNAGTPTTLYAIDSTAGTLVTIGNVDGVVSPNTGQVTTIGTLGLGTNLNESIGFDISAASGTGFATITTGGISRLYTINLATGAATLVGDIGVGTTVFPGMTVAATPAVPAGEILYSTNGSSITTFSSASTGLVMNIVSVTGMQSAETLVDIDLRPSTGQVYGVGSTSRLYVINPVNGVATQVGSAGAFTLNGTAFGLDFNPNVDRIRQVSNTEQNLRLNPDGTLTATDTAITPPGNIVSTAYDRNDLNVGTLTTLYAIDSAAGTLVTIGSVDGSPISPNSGQTTAIGSLGLGTNLNENIGFDISAASGVAFATITTAGISRLYTINLATGSAAAVGNIGPGTVPYLGVTVAAPPAAPTAAQVTISGRIMSAKGAALRGAVVKLMDDAGRVRSTVTNAFGYYSFDRVEAGRSFVIGAAAKRYNFTSKLITVSDTLGDLNMVAEP